MSKMFILAAGLLLTCSLAAHADGSAQYEARNKAFKKLLVTSFEPMGLVVRDREPYDKQAFLSKAQLLAQLSREPWQYFTPGSGGGKSRAKPEVWSKSANFKAAQNKFIASTDNLAKVAAAGNLQDIKRSYSQVAESCKACHDVFRGPKL